MKKENLPNRRAGNDKYGIHALKVEEHKDFALDGLSVSKLKKYYDKIRQSACYYSKDGRSYSTRKLYNDQGDLVIRVYRNKKSKTN